ncbi:hypothetical protein [Conexibacter sp. DBS9H8]|uniref:hypothetical protein n=1 Tax=Conexibacter sp. DBS9H8 TaxID=2937801 RepID=UPI00200F9743|nr:hypothetical protein [Conexibacter sp. DBS9H8]
MTAKEQLQHEIDALDESQAAVALALVKSARDGTALVDIYGTPWGTLLSEDDADALKPGRRVPIHVPSGIQHIT